MEIGFLRERESNISPIVPTNIDKLLKFAGAIRIEKGIGTGASFADDHFENAKLDTRENIIRNADVLVQITSDLSDAELALLKPHCILIGQFAPFNDKEIASRLESKNISAFSLDMIPRTSLAQSMDVLSSMASIAGYQAVLVGLRHLPRYAPMMITAAGSIKPSKALILGAGVAGLQAIATARRMGAQVEAFDTRAAVKEEVQSLGAKFVEVEGATDDKDAGGYAVEQTEAYKQRQAELIQEHSRSADLVISTAQLRGRPAPVLIRKETVEAMKPGSVVVDLAASTGGNCEVSENAKTINHQGITVVGDSQLFNRMPQDASTLYSNNIHNFLKHIIKEGSIDLNSEDEILSKSLISKRSMVNG